MSDAASGLFGVSGQGSVRRKQVTLEFIAQKIVEEAQRETDGSEGLPKQNSNSVRRRQFRRRDEGPTGRQEPPGPTYRSSFGYFVRRERGRLAFFVYNNHPHAEEVEYGSGTSVRVKGDGYYAIPITKQKYDQLKARGRKLSPSQRARASQRSSLSYWRKRDEQLKKKKAALRRTASRRQANPGGNARISREELLRRAASFSRQRSRADRAIESLEASLGTRKQPSSFPGLGKNGKRYLFTKKLRPYGGYGILRRATATVVNQYLRP